MDSSTKYMTEKTNAALKKALSVGDQKKIQAITKAIAYAENGGKPNLANPSAGASGEMKSIYQFTPATWKGYAKEIAGDENLPLTNETESYIVHEKVKKWVEKGYNTEQIASMWNAGPGRPNAYKENWKGTNKYGVKYDTPAYAKRVSDYATTFEKSDPFIETDRGTGPANDESKFSLSLKAKKPEEGAPQQDLAQKLLATARKFQSPQPQQNNPPQGGGLLQQALGVKPQING